MVAIFSKATSVAGVTAYQDSEDKSQFWYYPTNIDCILGDNLKEFKTTHWGIGKHFYSKTGNRIDSIVGAILAGKAAIDISKSQREQIITQIRKDFGVNNPKLAPLSLTDVKVQPVIGTSTLNLGKDADIIFPQTIQLGTAFNYLIGTGNDRFARFVATQQQGNRLLPNPSFAINITGKTEFQGDPWTVEVTADLSQVWTYARKRASAKVSLGWFTFSLGDYEKIVEDLRRDKVITINQKEGSLDNERYGRQILEMGKQVFEAVNSQSNSQSGFFKFEPNRVPETAKTSSGISWPWTFSVNLAYSHQAIKSTQSMHYRSTISYTGRFKRDIPASMTLAVDCNAASKDHFQDLGDTSEPCITQAKIDEFNKRLGEEAAKKQRLLDILDVRLATGEITEEQYIRAVDIIINGVSTSTLMLVPTEQTLVATGKTAGLLAPEESFIRTLSDSDLEEILKEAIASEE